MTYVRASREVVSPDGRVPRRGRSRWLVAGGIGFGMVAATWTAVAMVAPSIVALSLSTGPDLRSEDPFAPKALALAPPLPEPNRTLRLAATIASDQPAPARQIAENTSSTAAGFMPALDSDGPQIADGVPLLPANSLAPSLRPVFADLTSYAGSDDTSDLAVPVVRSVETVAALPVAPATQEAEPLSPEIADAAVTGSIADAIPLPPTRDVTIADAVPLPPASPLKRSGPVLASLTPAERPPAPAPAPAISVAPPSYGNRTAVYDIAAHTVYLPNGERLEAHSGLGGMLDDPGSVHAKNRGATPPHTYDLTPREQLFHGVPALRLTPSDGASVYGRVGLLAHTYMLGPRGDSNGCVSFRDYNRFLRAYRNGEITKLAVVTSLSRSSNQIASTRSKRSWWFASSTD
jgi:hypothetical protein